MSGTDIRHRLFEAARDGGIEDLVVEAQEIIDLPLTVMDSACIVLAKHPLDEQPGCAHWNSYRPGEQVAPPFIHTAWREGHMPRLSESDAPILIDWGFAEREPRLTQELRWHGQPVGYALALDVAGERDDGQVEGFAAFCETATFLLAMRGRAHQASATFANALFHGLLSGSRMTPDALAALLESSRMELPGRYAVAALPLAPANGAGPAPDAMLFAPSDGAIMLPYADGDALYLLICGIRGSWRECAAFERLEAAVARLGVHCGVSRPFESLLDLRDHCWQAANALEIGEMREPAEAIHHFGRFALDAIVREAASHVPAAAFAHPALAAIEEYDREHDSALRDTVAAYLRNGGDAVRAAKALNIHKNTLHYRLARIADLSGFDVDDPVSRVLMHLALVSEELQGRGG